VLKEYYLFMPWWQGIHITQTTEKQRLSCSWHCGASCHTTIRCMIVQHKQYTDMTKNLLVYRMWFWGDKSLVVPDSVKTWLSESHLLKHAKRWSRREYKRHDIWGSRSIAPCILNLRAKRKWVKFKKSRCQKYDRLISSGNGWLMAQFCTDFIRLVILHVHEHVFVLVPPFLVTKQS
jgi:hypothetical protein